MRELVYEGNTIYSCFSVWWDNKVFLLIFSPGHDRASNRAILILV